MVMYIWELCCCPVMPSYQIKDYFSKSNDVPKIFPESIRCNRFESILQHLHLNDNTNLSASSDRLCKLRLLLDSLNESYQKHYGTDEHYSVDESSIVDPTVPKQESLLIIASYPSLHTEPKRGYL